MNESKLTLEQVNTLMNVGVIDNIVFLKELNIFRQIDSDGRIQYHSADGTNPTPWFKKSTIASEEIIFDKYIKFTGVNGHVSYYTLDLAHSSIWLPNVVSEELYGNFLKLTYSNNSIRYFTADLTGSSDVFNKPISEEFVGEFLRLSYEDAEYFLGSSLNNSIRQTEVAEVDVVHGFLKIVKKDGTPTYYYNSDLSDDIGPFDNVVSEEVIDGELNIVHGVAKIGHPKK